MGDASSPPPTARRTAEVESSSHIIPLRILTHNIRYATDTPDETERLWPDRFPHLSSHFKYHTRLHFAPQATIVCMQEVLHQQLLDLHNQTFNTSNSPSPSLDPGSHNDTDNDWTYVGVGRNDGKTKGEYSPIFFRKSAWQCIHFETVWLNETGEVGKKGWDAGSIRILTCAVLASVLPTARTSSTSASTSTEKSSSPSSESQKLILALNTHLDNDGAISRRESAKIILRVSSRLRSKYAPSFTFLAGDLNSAPEDGAYQVLNRPGSGFVDTRRLLGADDEKIYPLGNEGTFTGFPADAGAKADERIDFVHLGTELRQDENENATAAAENDKLREMVQSYGVLPNRFDDRVWLSDHRGVVVDLLIPL